MNEVPDRIGFGFSRAEDKAFSTAIRYMTRPTWKPLPLAHWSHMFNVYYFRNGVEARIHEALITEHGWCEKPISKLLTWENKDREKHIAEIIPLPIPAPVVADIWKESCSWIGVRTYAILQLGVFGASNLLVGRALCRAFPHLFSKDVGENQTVCSEGSCQIVGEKYPMFDLRRHGEKWIDMSPESAYQRVKEVLATSPYVRSKGI